MRVYVMRHGSSINPGDPGCPEETQRYLTDQGKLEVATVARALARFERAPDAVLASPYVRAMQTAVIACEVFGVDAHRVQETEALTPGASPAEFFRELARAGGDLVMCFGHAPSVDEILAYALNSNRTVSSMKKAGVYCLEVDPAEPQRSVLVGLYHPAALTGGG